MKKKRTNGLIALCILSGIYILLNVFTPAVGLVNGPMTDEDIREQKLQLLSSYNEETLELMGGMVSENVAMLEHTQEHHYTIHGVNLIIYILGAFAVILLFRQQKLGFHLYLMYCIFEIAATLYFFGQFRMILAATLFIGVVAVVFIILYWQQVKKMDATTTTNEVV
jgi:hypothetical protein